MKRSQTSSPVVDLPLQELFKQAISAARREHQRDVGGAQEPKNEEDTQRQLSAEGKLCLEKREIARDYGITTDRVDVTFTGEGWGLKRPREIASHHRALRRHGSNPKQALRNLCQLDEREESTGDAR